MNINELALCGPYHHENLTLFLLTGADALDGRRFIPLEEALEQKCVAVHETGNVGELEVENLSEAFDLYIQAGDVVKGGRQDRTLGVDFVLPAKSGRAPIPSFCVERGRWQRRAGEAVGSFSSSKSSLASKKLRMAAKLSKDQGEVWQKIAEVQAELSAGVDKPIHAAASPTSYQLSIEDEDLQKRRESYRGALVKAIDDQPEALGYVFAINGEINTADAYGSAHLFRKLWSKLLDAAALEAIAELAKKPQAPVGALTAKEIRQWLIDSEQSPISEQQEIPPRVRLDTRRGEKIVVFETRDHGFGDAVLHKNLITV